MLSPVFLVNLYKQGTGSRLLNEGGWVDTQFSYN